MTTVYAPHLDRKRRQPWLIALSLGALGCVLLARAAGIAPARLQPVAGFLGIVSASLISFGVVTRMTLRRAQKQRNAEIPWGVRLTEPVWLLLRYPLIGLGAGGILGAVGAVLGFPGVGLGAFLTIAAFGVFLHFGKFGMHPAGLTFESDGLRVHIRGGTFLVRWTAITQVEGFGPEHFQMISLRVRDLGTLVGSAEPDTARVRARVETFVDAGPASAGRLTFVPWTAGLDGPTVVRTIGAAVRGQLGRMN